MLVDYTIQDVAAHKTTTDCWSAINGGVYDLTKWIPQHQGGPAVITALCGIDGSAAFNAKHGTDVGAATALKSYKIGNLVVKANTAAAATITSAKVFTRKQVARHHFVAHCWTIANRNVYNLSRWTAHHANRRALIKAVCGKDSTRLWNQRSGGAAKTSKKLKSFWVGKIGTLAAAPVAAAATPAATPAPAAAPVPSTTAKYTLAQVKAHASASSCWAVISGGVYNLTAWIGQHPGGPDVIKAMCGTDGTASFTAMHSSSATAKAALGTLQIGVIG